MVGLESRCALRARAVWAVQPTDSHGRSCTCLQLAYRSPPTKLWCGVSVWFLLGLGVLHVLNWALFHIVCEESTILSPLGLACLRWRVHFAQLCIVMGHHRPNLLLRYTVLTAKLLGRPIILFRPLVQTWLLVLMFQLQTEWTLRLHCSCILLLLC